MTAIAVPGQRITADVNATGLATEAKQDVIIGHIDGVELILDAIRAKTDNLDAPLSSVATETTVATLSTEETLQKVRSWPYADWDYRGWSWNAGTFTETVVYKAGGAGGTTVGTATYVYTDATKQQLVSDSYSPGRTP